MTDRSPDINVRCAWCGLIIQEVNDGPWSDSICPECRERMEQQIEEDEDDDSDR